jgi:hypothetical protein
MQQLFELCVILAELDACLPIIQRNQPVFIIIQYPEQFLRLLFGDIN